MSATTPTIGRGQWSAACRSSFLPCGGLRGTVFLIRRVAGEEAERRVAMASGGRETRLARAKPVSGRFRGSERGYLSPVGRGDVADRAGRRRWIGPALHLDPDATASGPGGISRQTVKVWSAIMGKGGVRGPAAAQFEKNHSGGYRDVEGGDLAGHRNPHQQVAVLADLLVQAATFAA